MVYSFHDFTLAFLQYKKREMTVQQLQYRHCLYRSLYRRIAIVFCSRKSLTPLGGVI